MPWAGATSRSPYALALTLTRRDVEIGDLSEEEIVAEVDKGVRAVLLKEDAPPPKVL